MESPGPMHLTWVGLMARTCRAWSERKLRVYSFGAEEGVGCCINSLKTGVAAGVPLVYHWAAQARVVDLKRPRDMALPLRCLRAYMS